MGQGHPDEEWDLQTLVEQQTRVMEQMSAQIAEQQRQQLEQQSQNQQLMQLLAKVTSPAPGLGPEGGQAMQAAAHPAPPAAGPEQEYAKQIPEQIQ